MSIVSVYTEDFVPYELEWKTIQYVFMKNEQISGYNIQIFEHATVGSLRFVTLQVG